MTYYPEFALEALSRKKEEWRIKKNVPKKEL